MNTPPRSLIAGIAAAAAAWPAGLNAQQSFGTFEFDKSNGHATGLEIISVFESPPCRGFAPVRVTTSNATTQPRSWTLDFMSQEFGRGSAGTVESRFEVAAEPGASASNVLLVPIANKYWDGWRPSSLELSVRGGGDVKRGNVSGQMSSDARAIAISRQLAAKSLTALDDEVKNISGRGYGSSTFGSRFDPAMLPEDWLGFSGFDVVMMTGEEWLAAPPGARTAILQWTRFGGWLHLHSPNDAATLAEFGIPGATDKNLARGLGEIKVRWWNNDALDAPATVANYKGPPLNFAPVHEEFDSTSEWPLLEAIGERNFAGWQVIAFLFLFGILVGPVNLFVLAPSGRRHRLFFTTPVISLGASLVLIVIILLQDGLGGQGRRFISINLEPDDATAYVIQEQVSRTGVLLSSAFELPVPAALHQVVMPDSPWTKLKNSQRAQSPRGSIQGRRCSGDWFQSRTEQGQFVQAAIPTRGRIELAPEGKPDAPVIVSSLETELAEFAYRDSEGRIWKSPAPVKQGVPVTLVQDANLEFWRGAGCRPAHESLRKALAARADQNSTFVATAKSAPAFVIESLRSIKWKDDHIVVWGPVVGK